MANAIRSAAQPAVAEWACKVQRGFLPNFFILDNVIEIETEAMIASSVSAYAALIFFDFAAAFPSVAHAFIFITLHALGVPRNVIRAIKQLYKNNVHILRLGRSSMQGLVAQTGVKQGCPLSGLLFVIVCDALLRVLCAASGLRDMTRAYADDVGMVLHNLWASGPQIAKLFNVFEMIAGLRLKAKKCKIVPLWAYEIGKVKEGLASLVSEWAAFDIVDCAIYLGIWLGPGAGCKTWDDPMSKYMVRCRTLRGLGLGLQASAYQYNMFCVSVLSYIWQLMAAPPQALIQEAYALQLLTAGPWNALPCSFLGRMETCGFKTGFADLATRNLAAMARTALHTSSTFSCMVRRLEMSTVEDEATLAPALLAWHKTSIVQQLEGAVRKTSILGTLDAKELLPLCVQFDVRVLLRKRLQRWLDHCNHSISISAAVERAVDVLKDLEGKVPPSVLAALWKTWCNGWCTSRRFQSDPRNCLLDAECGGSNDLEHYACCPATKRYLCNRVPHQSGPDTLLEFLLLEQSDGVQRVFGSLHIYAVFGAVNKVRAGQLPHGSFDLDMLLWERWRHAMSQKQSIYHAIGKAWLSATRQTLK